MSLTLKWNLPKPNFDQSEQTHKIKLANQTTPAVAMHRTLRGFSFTSDWIR